MRARRRVADGIDQVRRESGRGRRYADGLSVATLHGAEIETYNDHRMAMCFAILGLKVPGIKIKNPACVKKTFPNFFQKLAAPPPHGLGATIWEVKNGSAAEIERRRFVCGLKLTALSSSCVFEFCAITRRSYETN